MRLWIAVLLATVLPVSTVPHAAEDQAGENDPDAAFEMIEVERFEQGDPERGERLYLRYCRGCHGEKGRGAAHTFMPHVGNLTKEGYIEHLPDGYLYTVIAEGGEAVGKSGYMPAWKSKLSDDDIKDVIAHIRTLPTY